MTNTATKPTTGKLIQELPSGRTRVLEQNKPFPVLQKLKKGIFLLMTRIIWTEKMQWQ